MNGLIHFPHLTRHFKTAAKETNAKPQLVVSDDALTILPRTTETITASVDQLSELNTTGTATPLERVTEIASLLICHSMSTIFDKKVANTTESPESIKKDTQIAEFFIVTPEQSNYIKQVDMAVLSMIPEGDPNLTACLNDILRTNKAEQQNLTYWFLLLKIPANLKITPIQLRNPQKINRTEKERRTLRAKQHGNPN